MELINKIKSYIKTFFKYKNVSNIQCQLMGDIVKYFYELAMIELVHRNLDILDNIDTTLTIVSFDDISREYSAIIQIKDKTLEHIPKATIGLMCTYSDYPSLNLHISSMGGCGKYDTFNDQTIAISRLATEIEESILKIKHLGSIST